MDVKKDFYDAVINYMMTHGAPPSRKEMDDMIAMYPKQDVKYCIQIMQDSGMLDNIL